MCGFVSVSHETDNRDAASLMETGKSTLLPLSNTECARSATLTVCKYNSKVVGVLGVVVVVAVPVFACHRLNNHSNIM